eukprot:scaffold227072_cov35-Tisochrysis_lutea.AAC.1
MHTTVESSESWPNLRRERSSTTLSTACGTRVRRLVVRAILATSSAVMWSQTPSEAMTTRWNSPAGTLKCSMSGWGNTDRAASQSPMLRDTHVLAPIWPLGSVVEIAKGPRAWPRRWMPDSIRTPNALRAWALIAVSRRNARQSTLRYSGLSSWPSSTDAMAASDTAASVGCMRCGRVCSSSTRDSSIERRPSVSLSVIISSSALELRRTFFFTASLPHSALRVAQRCLIRFCSSTLEARCWVVSEISSSLEFAECMLRRMALESPTCASTQRSGRAVQCSDELDDSPTVSSSSSPLATSSTVAVVPSKIFRTPSSASTSQKASMMASSSSSEESASSLGVSELTHVCAACSPPCPS